MNFDFLQEELDQLLLILDRQEIHEAFEIDQALADELDVEHSGLATIDGHL
ncbi:MAG: hypothetical protein ACM3S1_00670 [Hyphomicrobiales bacterium]